MNKYVTGKIDQAYYPYFLKYLQDELQTKGLELHFVFFSELMKNNILGRRNHYYNSSEYAHLTEDYLLHEAGRIERDYAFTFKQAWFPDILQTSKKQNGRKIGVPEDELNDLGPLVNKFLYLEDLIQSEEINVIFSDVSPEAEMEFGRAIGLKHNIPVLKSYEGSFLGRTILLQHLKFGKDRLVEPNVNTEYSLEDAEQFLDDFIENRRPPYIRSQKLVDKKSFFESVEYIINYGKGKFTPFPLNLLRRLIIKLWLLFESSILKQTLYSKFEPNKPYLYFGFHLNQESTMGLRALPYVNQTALVEILSRVLPYDHTLYIREHPHWPKTFPFKYLKKCKDLPNVKLLSPKISIHDILKNSNGILVYNANTGIEALMHGKPVLSFASNIYYNHHQSVLHCSDLFELGEKLSILVNMPVQKGDTIAYLQKLNQVSIEFSLGSDMFLSESEARQKAERFSKFFILAVDWLHQNTCTM